MAVKNLKSCIHSSYDTAVHVPLIPQGPTADTDRKKFIYAKQPDMRAADLFVIYSEPWIVAIDVKEKVNFLIFSTNLLFTRDIPSNFLIITTYIH